MAKRVSGLGEDRADLIAQMTGRASASEGGVSNGNKVAEPQRRSMLQTLKAGAGPEQMRRIPVSDIIRHPDNPRRDLGDLAGLAKSIKENGQYQPILVTPVEDFVQHFPHHAETVAGKKWVVDAGNRRHAAHELANLPDILAIPRPVKDKLDSYITFVEENLKRQDFSAIEEALAFEQVRDAGGLTQRQTADRLNVSASHVNKRLALLGLAQPLQDAIVTGLLAPSDALNVTGLTHPEQVRIWEFARRSNCLLATAVVRIADADARAAARAANEAAAAKAGAKLIEDPRAEWAKPSDHALYGAEEIRAAAKAKTLMAHVTDKGLVYYASAPTEVKTGATAAEQAAAAKARAQVASTWVARDAVPGDQALMARLTRLTLSGGTPNAAVKLTFEWLRQDVNSEPPAPDSKAWLDWLQTGVVAGSVSNGNTEPTEAQRQRVAWAMTVAADEIAARTSLDWDASTTGYVTELIERHGYQPSPWEAAQIAALAEEN